MKYFKSSNEGLTKRFFELDGSITSEFLYVFCIDIEKWSIKKFFIEKIKNTEEEVKRVLGYWCCKPTPVLENEVKDTLNQAVKAMI